MFQDSLVISNKHQRENLREIKLHQFIIWGDKLLDIDYKAYNTSLWQISFRTWSVRQLASCNPQPCQWQLAPCPDNHENILTQQMPTTSVWSSKTFHPEKAVALLRMYMRYEVLLKTLMITNIRMHIWQRSAIKIYWNFIARCFSIGFEEISHYYQIYLITSFSCKSFYWCKNSVSCTVHNYLTLS